MEQDNLNSQVQKSKSNIWKFVLVGGLCLLGGAFVSDVGRKMSTPSAAVESSSPIEEVQPVGPISPISTKVELPTPSAAPSPTPLPSPTSSLAPIATPTVKPTLKSTVTAAPEQTFQNSGNNDTYVNVNGNTIQSPVYSETVPSGASAQCNDGTYSFSQNRRGTCSGHGGVASWL